MHFTRVRLVSKHRPTFTYTIDRTKTRVRCNNVLLQSCCNFMFSYAETAVVTMTVSRNALRSGHVSNQRTSRCTLDITTDHRQITDHSLPITYFSATISQGPFVLMTKPVVNIFRRHQSLTQTN